MTQNDIKAFKLENEYLEVIILNIGASVKSIVMKDKNQKQENLLLSYDENHEFQKYMDGPYLNAIIGPIAGRIDKGQFNINDKAYQLSINNGYNHLHGGINGLSFQVFDIIKYQEDKIILSHQSGKYNDGYPSTITTEVTYKLIQNNLILEIKADVDAIVPLNYTNHMYFNLNGNGKGDIMNHELQINAKDYMYVNDQMITTGKKHSVNNTCFDFRRRILIHDSMIKGDHSFEYTKGIDHPFIIESNPIILSCKQENRKLTINTNQKAVVVYTGNFLEGPYQFYHQPSKNHQGICLETQAIPNAINIKDFMRDVIYNPNKPYYFKTTYTFSTY